MDDSIVILTDKHHIIGIYDSYDDAQPDANKLLTKSIFQLKPNGNLIYYVRWKNPDSSEKKEAFYTTAPIINSYDKIIKIDLSDTYERINKSPKLRSLFLKM